MKEIDGPELKEFRLVLVTLACQTWTLSCLFARVPFPTSTLQAALISFNARLKKLSAFLLIDKSLPKRSLEAWPSLHIQKVYIPSRDGLTGRRLEEIFRLFTPVYALSFALNDYYGRGGTGRKNDPCYWIAGGDTAMEISPADEAISEVFLGVAAECENQILNILSEFHFFTERISVFYPNFSPRSKTISSDMVGPTPLSHVSKCLVRILQGGSRPFGGDVCFGTDPNKIVTAEYYTWAWQLRVPNVVTLRLREIGKPVLERFAEGERTSKDLDQICHIIMYLAMVRRMNKRFADIFAEPGVPENVAAAEILLFRDELRVSIDYARIKEKTVCLFENCLVFARKKGHELIIVHQVSLSDLLQVRYQFEHHGKGSGFLEIYWREHQPSNERKVSGARMFVNDLDVLKIWAAFLAITTSTEPAIGSFVLMACNPWNMTMLFNRTTLRDVVALVPEIELVCWGAIGKDVWPFV